MTRAEQIRAFWDARIPDFASFYLSDVARYTRGMLSHRTLQRRAADGSLPVLGGPDRALRHVRVLRTDLLDFLCALDSLTGLEPPPPKPRAAQRPRKPHRKKPRRKTRPAGPVPPRDQIGLFEPEKH